MCTTGPVNTITGGTPSTDDLVSYISYYLAIYCYRDF